MTDTNKIFDGLLILEYRGGSKKALGVLVNKYHRRLCRHACYYTKDMEAAQDVVQDSWGIMIRKLGSLKEPNLFGSWAFKIVTRKALNWVKQNKNRTKALTQRELIAEVNEAEENGVQNQKVKSAISKLKENQQIVLRLFYTESYSLLEIASILGISVGTVKSRLFHAREKLKTILKS